MVQHGSPHYTYSVRLLLAPVMRVLLGRPSSPSHDAALLLRGADPQPCVLNAGNIPPEIPFVITVNHYDRRGLGAWWGIATVMCALAERRTREPRELHFAMAREWWYPGGFGRLVKQPFTKWAFGQLGKSYGLVLLPPVLGHNEFRGEGTLSIRHALEYTRGMHQPGGVPQLVGLSPEGNTGKDLALCKPPEGAGLFILMLTHDEIPIMPVGIYEDEDCRLTVNFGPPFRLQVPRRLERTERDRAAASQVMVEIGKLLPERMWGAYREEVESAREHAG